MGGRGELFVGLDVGSRTSKAVLLDEDANIVATHLDDSKYSSSRAGLIVFETLLEKESLSRASVRYVMGTGYGRVNLSWTDASATEIRCHARGAHHLNPRARTVIDIGGQDSKAIAIGPEGEVVKFLMNDKCAAGCGRFIETILKHALDTSVYELDEYNIDLANASNITSTCTVFAESEVISLLAEGTPKEEIIAGLFRAIASRVGNLVKKVGIKDEVVFSGGVAKNNGVRRAMAEHLRVDIKTFENGDPQLAGALGAALIARERILSAAPIEAAVAVA